MSSIDTQSAVNQAASSLRNHAATAKNKEALGKDDFLNLFMTQMAHQDPTDPMDSSKMMNQFAQLGVMEQIQNLNQQMEKLNQTQTDVSRLQSMNYIGKDVSTAGDKINFARGKASPISYQLPQNVLNLDAQIKDRSGEIVATQELGKGKAGKHQFTWNGKDEKGVLLPHGNYQVEMLATNEDGTRRPVKTFQTFKVDQIAYENGVPILQSNGNAVAMGDVKSIDQRSYELFGNAQPLPVINNLSPKGAQAETNEKVEEVH